MALEEAILKVSEIMRIIGDDEVVAGAVRVRVQARFPRISELVDDVTPEALARLRSGDNLVTD